MIELLILLLIAGAVIYIVGILPIDGTIATIIKVVAVVMIVIYILRHLGALGLG